MIPLQRVLKVETSGESSLNSGVNITPKWLHLMMRQKLSWKRMLTHHGRLIKSGRAKGMARQIEETSMTLQDKSLRVIGYAPDNYSQSAWKSAAENGMPIARNFDELVSILKEAKKQ